MAGERIRRLLAAAVAGVVIAGAGIGSTSAALAAKPSGGGGGAGGGGGGKGAGTLTGTVTKVNTAVGLPGMCVTARNSKGLVTTTKTDGAGGFTVSLAAASYSVTFASCAPSDAYAAQTQSVNVLSGKTMTAAARMAPSSRGRRAMWLWQFPNASINPNIISFIRTNNVTDVFVAVTATTLPQNASAYADLIGAATAGGTNVSALFGDPNWVKDDGGALAVVQAVRTYNTAHPNVPLSALHLDVEPWALTDWSTNQTTYIQGYLWTLDDVKKSGGGLPVEADITDWLNTVGVDAATTLDTAVAQRTDRVTIMSFRATGADILSFSAAEYSHLATTVGKPVRLAVDTTPGTSSTLSFAGSTLSAMYPQLALVDAGRTDPAYLGVAIEDYASWSAMTP